MLLCYNPLYSDHSDIEVTYIYVTSIAISVNYLSPSTHDIASIAH